MKDRRSGRWRKGAPSPAPPYRRGVRRASVAAQTFALDGARLERFASEPSTACKCRRSNRKPHRGRRHQRTCQKPYTRRPLVGEDYRYERKTAACGRYRIPSRLGVTMLTITAALALWSLVCSSIRRMEYVGPAGRRPGADRRRATRAAPNETGCSGSASATS
jgi:hypothetical protein